MSSSFTRRDIEIGTIFETPNRQSYSMNPSTRFSKVSYPLQQLLAAVAPEKQYGPAQTCINNPQWTLFDPFVQRPSTSLGVCIHRSCPSRQLQTVSTNLAGCCRCTTQRAARWHCVTPARAASTCCAWVWSGRSCQRGTGPAPAVLSARACPPSASLWMKSRTGSPLEAAGAFPLMSVC